MQRNNLPDQCSQADRFISMTYPGAASISGQVQAVYTPGSMQVVIVLVILRHATPKPVDHDQGHGGVLWGRVWLKEHRVDEDIGSDRDMEIFKV